VGGRRLVLMSLSKVTPRQNGCVFVSTSQSLMIFAAVVMRRDLRIPCLNAAAQRPIETKDIVGEPDDEEIEDDRGRDPQCFTQRLLLSPGSEPICEDRDAESAGAAGTGFAL
jgi:hypothetical protein